MSLREQVWMHVLSDCSCFDDGDCTKLEHLPADQKPMEDERVALERLIAKAGFRVGVRRESATESLSAIAIQDTGLMLGAEVFLPARFRNEIRSGEASRIAQALKNEGLTVLESTPHLMYWEGGDLVPVGDTLLIGVGHRTDTDGAKWVVERATQHGWKTRVIPLTASHLYPHLSTGLSWAGRNRDGQHVLVRNRNIVPDISAFSDLNVKIVEVDPNCPREFYGANVLPVGGSLVVRSGCELLVNRILDAGIRANIVELPWDTMTTGKVGFTCTCLMLTRNLHLANE